MAKQHHYEIVDTNSNKPLGTVWWDSEKKSIGAKPQHLLDVVQYSHSGIGYEGETLLKNLPRLFRSGYMTVRKVK